MTKQEAKEFLKYKLIDTSHISTEFNYVKDVFNVAIECIEKCIEIGSCKECKSADFCYDHPDVCFCLQHDHTMYADDTCNYFYSDRGDNDD